MSTNPPTVSSTPVDRSPRYRTLNSEPRSSWWGTVLGWLLMAGLAAGGWYSQAAWLPLLDPILGKSKPPVPKKNRVVPVSTAIVRQRDMPQYLNGLGTVTAFRTVTIRSRVEGEVRKIAFTEGQMVNEGDLLAEIDPRQFEVQLAQAEGQLARDEAILKTAKATLSRYEGLAASKSIAAQQVDDQAALVQQTMASIQTDEATIADARLQLTYCRIVAPISGRIGLRLVDQGNIVRANEPNGLAVITQLQPIALVFTIPQDDIARVQQRANGPEPLQVEAFDRDFKQRLALGTLVAVDNQVDATTGTVRLKAQFANDDGMLFPNQFVNARLLVDTRRNAIVVPSAAIQTGPNSMFVYVVQDDKKVEMRNVVIGPAEGGETTIESGVAPGEMVVTDGLDKLQPGATVSFRDAGKKEGQGKSTGKENPSREQDKGPARNGDSAAPPKTKPISASEKSSSTNAAERPSAELTPRTQTTESETKPKTQSSCADSESDHSSPASSGKDVP
ncbi:MAG: MdtA/MuxA family multidrug efflux RND transporter periplasmic adaptor subunit [Planctomycetes bacterium]|nr:MdtA/MuxA family multidrug efflux RND transporter periplasmic adaptor subunit [Planctomycetota bacterium]